MIIAVNLTHIMHSKHIDGVGQFALNLLRGWQAAGRLGPDIHLLVADNFYEKCRGLFSEASIIPIARLDESRIMNRYYRFSKSLIINRYLLPRFLNRHCCDLLYHPFNNVNDHISTKVPTIITLHDLFFQNHPEEFGGLYLRYLQHWYREMIYHSRQIVTPSEFVKQDILKYYPDVNPDKITVINNPIWIECSKTQPYPVPKPYILSVNSIRNHKNLITLLKAYQLIQDQVEHYLILTGAQWGVRMDPEQYAATHNIKKLIMTCYVADEERNYLYQNADLFVSPSLHEGFGMTPVEAALFEIPVLTTRETSIPEITRNMVNYYEPAEDHHALAQRMLDLLRNRPPQGQLRHIKNTLAQEYDVKKKAAEYWELFTRMHG